jgi:hypothetical protein
MNIDLKNRILGNRFDIDLRSEGVINYDEYHSLCQALKELALEWRDTTLIDKEIAEDIFGTFIHVSGELWSMENSPVADEACRLVRELHFLIQQCFATPKTPDQALHAYNERLKLWGKDDLSKPQ